MEIAMKEAIDTTAEKEIQQKYVLIFDLFAKIIIYSMLEFQENITVFDINRMT